MHGAIVDTAQTDRLPQRASNLISVRFNALPRAAREHWGRVAVGPRGENVLGFSSGGVVFPVLGWLALIAVGFAIGLPHWTLLHSNRILLQAIAAFLIALATWRILVALRPAPWVRGLYLFPGMFVDARSDTFTIVPFDLVSAPQIIFRTYGSSQVSRVLVGGIEIFNRDRHGWDREHDFVQPYLRARERYQSARASNDVRVLRLGNPFYDCEVSGHWQSAPEDALGPRYATRNLKWFGWALAAITASGAWLALRLSMTEEEQRLDARLTSMERGLSAEELRREAQSLGESRLSPLLSHASSPESAAFLRALLGDLTETRNQRSVTLFASFPESSFSALGEPNVSRGIAPPALSIAPIWRATVLRQVHSPLQAAFDTVTEAGSEAARRFVSDPYLVHVYLDMAPTEQPSAEELRNPILEIRLEATNGGPAEQLPGTTQRCLLLGLRGTARLEAPGAPPIQVPIELPALSGSALRDAIEAAAGPKNDGSMTDLCYRLQLESHLAAVARSISSRVFSSL